MYIFVPKMKELFIYIFLVSYLNMALVPHLGETDVFIRGSHQQVDEINSFYEQVMVTLGYDTTSDDEDGDSGTEDDGTSNSLKTFQYYPITLSLLRIQSFLCVKNLKSKNLEIEKFNISSIDFGIESPPPEV